MTRSIFVLFGVCALAACNSTSEIGQKGGGQKNDAGLVVSDNAAATPTFDPASLYPKLSTKRDRNLMAVWYRQNELCRGSSDAATIDAVCPKRDHTGVALERRGWCWAYEDLKILPPDYKWHRCSEKSLPSSAALATKLAPPTAEPSKVSPIGSPPTTALDRYKAAMEPIDGKAGRAAAVLSCGIQDQYWYSTVTEALNKRQWTMLGQLDPHDRAEAIAYDREQIKGEMKFLGMDEPEKACPELAKAPYVHNMQNFLP